MKKHNGNPRPSTAASTRRVARKALAVRVAAAPPPSSVAPEKPDEMEVHHHHHAPGRKHWKGYLFEFFMLFLAVFCGFVAEWQLEHVIERQRERQFIESLVEDLKRDTLEAGAYIQFHQAVLGYCDSLQASIRQPDLFIHSNAFYNYSRELARFHRYYPTDRTMQQLKNAGNMRLIRNWKVANAITDYDSKTKELSENDQQLNTQVTKYRDNLIEFADLSSFDQLNIPGSYMESTVLTQGNPGFIKADRNKAKVLYNQAFALKAYVLLVIASATEVKREAIGLLGLVQKEYGVK